MERNIRQPRRSSGKTAKRALLILFIVTIIFSVSLPAILMLGRKIFSSTGSHYDNGYYSSDQGTYYSLDDDWYYYDDDYSYWVPMEGVPEEFGDDAEEYYYSPYFNPSVDGFDFEDTDYYSDWEYEQSQSSYDDDDGYTYDNDYDDDDYDWDDDGWVIYTQYYDFTTPLINSDLTTWAVQNYKADSAFQVDGKLRLQYLCNLADSHADYLIKKALGFEKKQDVIGVLHAALKEVNPTASVIAASAEAPKKEELPITVVEENTFDANSVTVTSVVYHKAYGEGVVKRITDGKIYVRFGEEQTPWVVSRTGTAR